MSTLITTPLPGRRQRSVRATRFFLASSFSLTLLLTVALKVHCQPQGCEGEFQADSRARHYGSGGADVSLEPVEVITPPGRGTGATQEEEELRTKLERYKEELSRHRRNEDTEAQVRTLRQMALAYEDLNEQKNAVEHYTLILPLLQAEAKAPLKASVLYKLGRLSQRMGLYGQARDYLQQVLPLSRHVPTYILAEVHYALGLTNRFLGDRRQAFEHLRQSIPIYEKVRNRRKVAEVYALLGQLAPTLNETFDHYSRARAAFQGLGLKLHEGRMLESIGMLYGPLDERAALRYYKQALDIWKDVRDPVREAQTLMYMGQLYAVLGDRPNAEESYQTALSIWKTRDDRLGEAEVTRNLGDVAAVLADNKPDALRHLNHAASLWRAANKPVEEAHTLSTISLIQAGLGQRREALDTLSRLTSLAELTDTSGRRDGHLAFFIGLSYRRLNDGERALKYWQQALDIHQELGDQRGAAMVLVAIAAVYEAMGESHKALSRYLEAITIREKLIEEARLEELKIRLAEKSADAYHQAVLLAFKLGNHAQAFELSERARARALLDQLGNARINLRRSVSTELIEQERALRLEVAALQKHLVSGRALPAAQQLSAEEAQVLPGLLAVRQQEYGDLLVRLKASNPEYASLRAVDPIDLKRLQALLDESTTLVSYFVTPELSLAFIITRNSFDAVELCPGGRCVSERELKEAVTQFRGFADLSDPHPPSLRKLYGWLIQPIKEYLRTTTLCVIPHGALHYLPFAALSSDRKFLGETHGIYYLPSASVLRFIRRERAPAAAADTLLAVAQNNVQGAPVLKHAEETARRIAERYNTQALTGSAATETAFRARALGARSLFLAAHGKMNPSRPLFSSVSFAPDTENDGLLEVHEVYELDLREADNVVLSGCQTQLGELSRGDEVVGLNRAFLYAGTPTVIASLWSVRELQTGELMVSFYEGRRDGMSKADALRQAQALVRVTHPHPYYWAAFVLTGEP